MDSEDRVFGDLGSAAGSAPVSPTPYSLSPTPCVTWHDSLPSTQDESHRLAAAGAVHGTAVVARVQTAGRGTRGRTWHSEPGGLWLSVIGRPELHPAVEILGVRVGLALLAYLETLLPRPSPLALKWPNDLMLGNGKVGGILAEARWQGDRLGWVAVGIGLNLHNPLVAEGFPPPARLADAGVAATATALAEPIAAAMANALRSGEPLSAAELAAFAARDWLTGRPLLLPEQGVAQGISPAGRLLVRRADGCLVETLGTVELER
ncbi:MAG: biotin--[acetyl-CoA-carboxylase] ligase [Gemmatimonadales bacterium]